MIRKSLLYLLIGFGCGSLQAMRGPNLLDRFKEEAKNGYNLTEIIARVVAQNDPGLALDSVEFALEILTKKSSLDGLIEVLDTAIKDEDPAHVIRAAFIDAVGRLKEKIDRFSQKVVAGPIPKSKICHFATSMRVLSETAGRTDIQKDAMHHVIPCVRELSQSMNALSAVLKNGAQEGSEKAIQGAQIEGLAKHLKALKKAIAKGKHQEGSLRIVLRTISNLAEVLSETGEARRRMDLLRDAMKALVKSGEGNNAFVAALCRRLPGYRADANKNELVTIIEQNIAEFKPPKKKKAKKSKKRVAPRKPPFVYLHQTCEAMQLACDFVEKVRELMKIDNFHWNASYYKDAVLCERDAYGKTLIRYLAERWKTLRPIGEDEEHGAVCDQWGNIGHSYWYSNSHHGKSFMKLFSSFLDKKNALPQFNANLDDLLACMCATEGTEAAYQPLIEIFNRKCPGRLNAYKAGVRRAAAFQRTPEKDSAYFSAELFYEVLRGSSSLDGAFNLVKKYQALANACNPGGLPILHHVLHKYESVCNNPPHIGDCYCWRPDRDCDNCVQRKDYIGKKKSLEGLFCYLLMHGANPDLKNNRKVYDWAYEMRRYRYSGEEYKEYKQDGNGEEYREFKDDGQWPSVREVLDGTQEDVGGYYNSHWNARTPSWENEKISEETREIFKELLDKTTADANFPLSEYGWLKKKMPRKVVPVVEPEDADEDGEDFDALMRRIQEEAGDQDQEVKKSTWESWKPTVKWLGIGALTGLALYKWHTARAAGDPPQRKNPCMVPTKG